MKKIVTKIASFLMAIVLMLTAAYVAPVVSNDAAMFVIEAQAAKSKKLSPTSKTAKKVLKKAQFSQTSLSYLYRKGSFKDQKINKNVALSLAYSQIEQDEKNFNYDKGTVTVSKKVMKKHIKSIFGSSFSYKNKSFYLTNSKVFAGVPECEGKIVYKNGSYKGDCIFGGGEWPSFIYQELDKVVSSGSTVKVYVKTAFVIENYDSKTGTFSYKFYKNYNKDTEKCSKKLKTITEDQMNGLIGKDRIGTHQTISIKNSKTLSSTMKKCNTYVYKFKKAKNGEYYLNGFYKTK